MNNLKGLKDIGFISYLTSIHNLEIISKKTFENKSIMYFDNTDHKVDKLMAEYYNSDYVKFYDKTREIRQELFNSLKTK